MEISILIVFLAGLGSFLSPCIIPLVPSYLSYITGGVLNQEVGEKEKKLLKNKLKVVFHTVFFVLGFGTAFMTLQILIFKFTNLASKLIGNNVLNLVFGGIIIVMGLHMLGVFKITKLYSEKRMNFKLGRRNFGTSYLFGFAFGFGWTPCMGPVLFTVMSYLANSNTMLMGIIYIWIFTLGLGVPFLIFAFFLDKSRKLNFIKKNFLFTDKLSGIVLIIMGLLLASNKMTIFLSWSW
ncbi:MAG: sulfite exporter TauE/SafE family protein [Psychrilyobacter sp.]|nr:sulfite exporter TauE/SafE family protein [Psychrilyobacter sp.]